jgi:hypothetical protein
MIAGAQGVIFEDRCTAAGAFLQAYAPLVFLRKSPGMRGKNSKEILYAF